MASLHRRVHDRPHFIKIIVADTSEIEMLKIPTKFTKKHGSSLSNTLCLRVPNGGMWKVDVVKSDGEVWLRNGWKEFAGYYSLGYGSLLVFRYHGNSNFWVLIFDKSASEIDYPTHNIPGEESDLKEFDYKNLDERSSHKRRKVNSSSANLLPSDSQFATTDNKANVLKLEKSGKKSDRSREDLGVSNRENEGHAIGYRQFKSKVPAKLVTLSPTDTRACLSAEALRPKNPSFKIIMHSSYITGYQLTIPLKFAKRFLTHEYGNVTLSVSDERKWSVRYFWNMYKKGNFATLLYGWSAFVKDNSLKVGDVCLFELINYRNVLFKVVIFRDTSDANCLPSLDNMSIGDRVRKRRMGHKVEPSELSIDSSDDFSPGERREGKVKNEQLTPKDISIRRKPSSTKAPEPAGRSNPSFELVMLASYMRTRFMNVPGYFVKEVTQKKAVTVMLKVEDKLWPVNLINYGNNKSGKITSGFGAFLKENTIEAGDKCVFELIDKDDGIVNVTLETCWLKLKNSCETL